MSVNSGSVQDFVDQAVDEYERKSIIDDVIEVSLKDHLTVPSNKCRRETTISVGNMNNGVYPMIIPRLTDEITACEDVKIIKSLNNTSVLNETVGSNEFSKNLFIEGQRCLPHSNDVRLLLPDHFEYQDQLCKTYGTCDSLGHNNGPAIYWFDSDIFSRKGIVINNRVRVIQEKHGSRWPIVDKNMNIGSLPANNSTNRVKIHLGEKGVHPIKINMWTEFSDPQTFDDESICVLDLPDPNKV